MNQARALVSCCSAFVVFAALCAGCSADAGDGSSDGKLGGIGPASEADLNNSPGEAIELGLSMSAAPPDTSDSPKDKAGYTYIQYCDYPNNWVGTRCVWSSGSNFCAAVRECQSDTRSVCGSPTSTWTILTNAGDITMNSAISACN